MPATPSSSGGQAAGKIRNRLRRFPAWCDQTSTLGNGYDITIVILESPRLCAHPPSHLSFSSPSSSPLAEPKMVSTRNHPSAFPPPEPSPTKSSPRKSRNSTASPAPASHDFESSPSSSAKILTKRALFNSTEKANGAMEAENEDSAVPALWAHTASNVTVAWIAISLPLVICTSYLPVYSIFP